MRIRGIESSVRSKENGDLAVTRRWDLVHPYGGPEGQDVPPRDCGARSRGRRALVPRQQQLPGASTRPRPPRGGAL
jgi:hypothetical protein